MGKAGNIRRFKQNAKIDQPLIQLIDHVNGIPTDIVKDDARMRLTDLLDDPGNDPDSVRFSGTHIHIAGDLLIVPYQLRFRFLYQIQDLLRTLSQQHAILRQLDVVISPFQQVFSQFFFQLPQLPGQGGLGNVQLFRRFGDVLLPGNCEKIAQYSDFHSAPPETSIPHSEMLFKHIRACKTSIGQLRNGSV